MNPEAYLGKDVDLHIQLSACVTTILNKRVKNPHTRAEMIRFLAMLVPQSAVFHKDRDPAKRNQYQEH